MKPEELIKESINSFNAYSHYENDLYRYIRDNCILSYYKDKFGVMFIIKTKRKYMAFVGFNNDLSPHWRNAQRIEIERALSFMGDNIKIIDEDGFNKMKDKLLIEDI